MSTRLPLQMNRHLIVNRIPLIGILCFVLLFIFSSTLYPGGSQADVNSVGFDWVHNYWCNLMRVNGINGAINPARPFALFALIMLCGSIAVFAYQFAEFSNLSELWKKIIKWGGILSMSSATLLPTAYHDSIIIITSLFGLPVVIGIIKEIYGSSLPIYKASGVICLLLVCLNNVMYYTSQFIEWLPLIQKITFMFVLIWILGLNHEIRKRIKIAYSKA